MFARNEMTFFNSLSLLLKLALLAKRDNQLRHDNLEHCLKAQFPAFAFNIAVCFVFANANFFDHDIFVTKLRSILIQLFDVNG